MIIELLKHVLRIKGIQIHESKQSFTFEFKSDNYVALPFSEIHAALSQAELSLAQSEAICSELQQSTQRFIMFNSLMSCEKSTNDVRDTRPLDED